MFRLDGKVVVVIGGAGGFGEIKAHGLAGQGAKTYGCHRHQKNELTSLSRVQC